MTNKNTEDFLMSYLRKIPEDLKLGEEREVTCVCGGHIRMACNKCKFQLMQ